MEALITIPRNACFDKIIEVGNFSNRLAHRGYTSRTVEGDVLSVSLDGVPYNYDVLFFQSLDWKKLAPAKFKRLTETAQLPTRGSLDCAGLDLFADIQDSVVLPNGVPVMVPTGVAVQCPAGSYAQIKERSSLGAKGIAVRGGVVDRDYRGELKVILQYNSADPNDSFTINVGDRVAQLVFVNYIDVQAIEVESLNPTVRDGGGFGSTGR